MTERSIDVAGWRRDKSTRLLDYEWLVTNGLGGYASASVLGSATRRYHGLLVAALPAPWGRVMSLVRVHETASSEGSHGWVAFSSAHRPQCDPELGCVDLLESFALRDGLPEWRYRLGAGVVTKSLFMPNGQNTVHVTYTLSGDDASPASLRLAPFVHFRKHEEEVDKGRPGPYELERDRHDVVSCIAGGNGRAMPPLRMLLRGAEHHFVTEAAEEDAFYVSEEARGYPAVGRLWSPGFFECVLPPGVPVTLVASMEEWTALWAVPTPGLHEAELSRRAGLVTGADSIGDDAFTAELLLAADQFVISPITRTAEIVLAQAGGLESRSVVAGYHWFTEWGRDTMISLEGLCLIPGRHGVAEAALRVFANHLRDGLIPNHFPEGGTEGVYNTADATLWFMHALDRYVLYTGDHALVRTLLPRLRHVIERHLRGTRFGIGADPEDGLLRQGAAGYALTWMDAKMGDWVVTPRRGKAVEINALWYNALRLMERWLEEQGDAAAAAFMAAAAAHVHRSFNLRFWYSTGRHLFDVVDGAEGDDASCRPNQILALSLPHPVLDEDRWADVLGTVHARLLTPFGLRTLAPGSPGYRESYTGDLRSRDAAYHQGTVWPWLLGPFVDAWLRVHPGDQAGARRFLEALPGHMNVACIGQVSEIFDAAGDYTPRGCVAQAWSVAEVLRAWVKTGRNDKGRHHV